jgi:NitT/TauT family transport system substrate-binding protein
MMMLSSCESGGNRIETRLLLDWLPNPNHIPLYVGIQKGIFHKHGINLNIVKISDPGDSLAFISSGKADLSLYYMPEAYLAMSKGAQVKPIGYLIKQPLNALIYRKGEGIQTSQDLNGKKMGYVIGSFGLKFLRVLLDHNNIELGEAVNVSFDLVSTLGTKRVDAIYGAYFNIEGEHLRSLGIDTGYFTLHELGIPNYFELLVLANKNSPYVDPEFIQRFKSAMQISIDYAVQHPEEAYELYLHANPDKGTQAVSWEREAWLKTIPLLATNQDNEEPVWQAFGRWAIKNDIITQDAHVAGPQ